MARRLRGWGRADDDTDSLPVLAPDQVDEQASHDATGHGVPGAPDEEAAPVDHEATSTVTPATEREVPAWVKRFGDAVVARLPQLSAAIVGGMLLCLSFPPFGWWYAAIVAFALLAWVLTRQTTTLFGGFGYGFAFGAAFYIPLLLAGAALGNFLTAFIHDAFLNLPEESSVGFFIQPSLSGVTAAVSVGFLVSMLRSPRSASSNRAGRRSSRASTATPESAHRSRPRAHWPTPVPPG